MPLKRGPKRPHRANYKKGQSGNPSGRPKLTPEVRDVIKRLRDLTPKVADKLEAMLDDPDPRVAFAAGRTILEYGIGKPEQIQRVDVTVREKIQALSNEELVAKAKAIFAPRAALSGNVESN